MFSGSKTRFQFRAVNEEYLFALVVRVIRFCVCSVKKSYVRKLFTLVSS